MGNFKEPLIQCPNCGSRCRIRDSKKITRRLREVTAHCINNDCMQISVFNLEHSRFVVPRPPKNPKIRVEFVGA